MTATSQTLRAHQLLRIDASRLDGAPRTRCFAGGPLSAVPLPRVGCSRHVLHTSSSLLGIGRGRS